MACRLDGAKPLSEPILDIVNLTFRNKLQWNFNRNSKIFIQENAFENVVCEMVSISSRPQWVKAFFWISRVGVTFDISSVHRFLRWNDGFHSSTGRKSLLERFMGPTWGPSGADRTQVGPMLAVWTLLSGMDSSHIGSLTKNFDVSIMCAWANAWTNVGVTGWFDTPWCSYDVTVIHNKQISEIKCFLIHIRTPVHGL